MPLIAKERGSCDLPPELGDPSKAVSVYPTHDDVLANLDPGVGDEFIVSPGDSQAQTARDPASPQHTLRGNGAW